MKVPEIKAEVPEENIPAADEKADTPDAANEEEIAAGKNSSKPAASKTNPLLLIIYIIVAVPVTAALITMLLVLALGSLALSVGLFCVGGLLLATAFGSFAVFADVMIVLGASLILLALGILFLWLFVWLLGGAIVWLLKKAVSLGEKICVREVPDK